LKFPSTITRVLPFAFALPGISIYLYSRVILRAAGPRSVFRRPVQIYMYIFPFDSRHWACRQSVFSTTSTRFMLQGVWIFDIFLVLFYIVRPFWPWHSLFCLVSASRPLLSPANTMPTTCDSTSPSPPFSLNLHATTTVRLDSTSTYLSLFLRSLHTPVRYPSLSPIT
jgi:hypothetical protein